MKQSYESFRARHHQSVKCVFQWEIHEQFTLLNDGSVCIYSHIFQCNVRNNVTLILRSSSNKKKKKKKKRKR